LGLVFSLLYAFLQPPFQSPDEQAHFFRAWQVSEGGWDAVRLPERLGGWLPAGVAACAAPFEGLRRQGTRCTDEMIRDGWAARSDSQTRVFVDFANTGIYAAPGYLPQAIGIRGSQILGLPPLAALYAARLANIIAFFLVLYFVLRENPRWNPIVGYLVLLPSVLVLVASANPDVLYIALAWLLTLRLLARRSASWQDVLIACFMALQKLIAVPFALLFGGTSKPARQLGLTLLVLLCAALGAFKAQRLFVPYDHYDTAFRDGQTLNSGVAPFEQMAYVAAHPWQTATMLSKSFFRAIPSIAAHTVGKFGWGKNYLPIWVIGLLWMGLFGVVFTQNHVLSPRKRLFMLSVAVLYMAAFALSNYALWCPVGSLDFDNWQGRYFFPILPLVALATSNSSLLQWQKIIGWAALLILVIGNLSMTLELVFCRF
jgi:uncharacterized membrane protein